MKGTRLLAPQLRFVLPACLGLVMAGSHAEDNDLSVVPRPSYPARREVYRIPDLKKLAGRRLTNAFVYGDFIVRKSGDGTVVFQPYSAVGLLGNITDPQILRRLMAEGNLLLGASRIVVEEATSPIPLVPDFPIHIPLEAPLELLKVSTSQAGNVVAQARFREGRGSPAAPAIAAPPGLESVDKYLVTDSRNGTRVWRPYQGKIEWDGNFDASRLATGRGTLRVYARDGRLAAQIEGTMDAGRLGGTVTAVYPQAPDRASYRGAFANWSEHGRGVMTFRSGQTIEGIWRDGELIERTSDAPPPAPAPQREVAAGASVSVFHAGPSSRWTDNLANLHAESIATGQELETVYKQLRDAMPTDAKAKLTVAQRAWLVYQTTVLQLAQKHWGARPDSALRARQLDYALSLQRVEELRAMKAAFEGAPIDEPTTDLRLETQRRLSEVTRAIKAAGRHEQAAFDLTLAKWADSAMGGAQAMPLQSLRKEALVSAISNMAAQHQLDLFEFWHTAAWMKEAPPAEVTTMLAAKAAAGQADELLKEIAAAWTKAGPGELPAPLPSPTAEKLMQHLAGRPAGPETDSARWLRTAEGLQKALTAQPVDTGLIDGLLGRGSTNPTSPAWVKVFVTAVETRRAKALELQQQAIALLQSGDGEAAKGRARQAEQEYSSGALRAWADAMDVYDALARDKSLRAVDGDWRHPVLPEKTLLTEAARCLRAIRLAEGPEASPALRQLTAGLEAASLLASFAQDCEASGGKDTTHPVRALQALRRTEKYLSRKKESVWVSQPFLLRLQALEELVGPKLKEYETLLGQARALEAEGKYLKAAAAYRAVLALDSSREVQQDVARCESRTSGL